MQKVEYQANKFIKYALYAIAIVLGSALAFLSVHERESGRAQLIIGDSVHADASDTGTDSGTCDGECSTDTGDSGGTGGGGSTDSGSE